MKKLKITLNLITIVFLGSCASNVTLQEQMLPNGHWVIGLSDSNACNELIKKQNEIDENLRKEDLKKNIDKLSTAQRIKYRFTGELPVGIVNRKEQDEKMSKLCLEKFQESITARADELCGNKKYMIYGCLNNTNSSKSGFTLNKNEGDFNLKCYINCNPDDLEKNNSRQ